MLIEPRPATDPELLALVTAQQREILNRAPDARGEGISYPASEGIRYLVGIMDGRAVACGAVQVLSDRIAEIKRMYVRPAYRRRGIARQMLAALEDLAWTGGHETVRVETADHLVEAVKFYTSAGYDPIASYGDHQDNPLSLCFEKRLPAFA